MINLDAAHCLVRKVALDVVMPAGKLRPPKQDCRALLVNCATPTPALRPGIGPALIPGEAT